MAPFRLLKVGHFNLEAWINPGHAVLFRQRTEETEKVRQDLCADSAAHSSPVNHPVLSVLYDHQCPKEAAMTAALKNSFLFQNNSILPFKQKSMMEKKKP